MHISHHPSLEPSFLTASHFEEALKQFPTAERLIIQVDPSGRPFIAPPPSTHSYAGMAEENKNIMKALRNAVPTMRERTRDAFPLAEHYIKNATPLNFRILKRVVSFMNAANLSYQEDLLRPSRERASHEEAPLHFQDHNPLKNGIAEVTKFITATFSEASSVIKKEVQRNVQKIPAYDDFTTRCNTVEYAEKAEEMIPLLDKSRGGQPVSIPSHRELHSQGSRKNFNTFRTDS